VERRDAPGFVDRLGRVHGLHRAQSLQASADHAMIRMCIYAAFILTMASCVPGCAGFSPILTKGAPMLTTSAPAGAPAYSGRYYCDGTPMVCVTLAKE
jgi:hypothetical protein